MNETIPSLVRRHDPERFLTALFAPPEKRDALLTLYAFDHELARAREVTSEPHLALIRLQWWREVVEGQRRRHEVATPLGAMLDQGLPRAAGLLAVIDAYETETRPAIETLDEWREWLLAGAGGIAVAAGELLRHPEPEILRTSGAAYGAARVIRWNAVHASRGRCLLPEDLLAEHGISLHEAIDSPSSPPVTAVLRRLAEQGRTLLSNGPRRASRAHVAALLPAVLAQRDLRRESRVPQGAGLESRPGPRRLADRCAVMLAGFSGRV